MKKMMIAAVVGVLACGAVHAADDGDFCALDVSVMKQSIKSVDEMRKTYGQVASKTAWYPQSLYTKIDNGLQMQVGEIRMNVMNKEAVLSSGNRKVCSSSYGLDNQKKLLTLSGALEAEIAAIQEVEKNKAELKTATGCTSTESCNNAYLQAFFIIEKKYMDYKLRQGQEI